MARYTKAYSSLITRLDEVYTLRHLAADMERANAINLRNEINALCRGAIVLLSGHLEGYIKDLGEVVLDALHAKQVDRAEIDSRFYYHISKDLLDEVFDTHDPEKIADKLFTFVNKDLHYWSRSGPFPHPVSSERFNKGFSNPAIDKICTYFNRFGYSEYKRDLERLLKAAYTSTENMVNHLVDTRNRIAHGDSSATKTPQEVSEMIGIIRTYCKTTDSVFAAWCKTKFCAIR